jgi:glycosyltransferase involved in cell wall biosynthesis
VKPKILVFVVAYNAEQTIEKVLSRIPAVLQDYETEILVIDDASQDATFEVSETIRRASKLLFKLTVLVNPINQGYGGNQKLGFRYAIDNGFDIVALLHGDGQYAPEALPRLLRPLLQHESDAVFGSRMLQPFAALRGGMPLYKFIGNKILTVFENLMLRTQLSEFHSGYRLYSVAALRCIPFELNTNDFHFDTEIIVQLLFGQLRIQELPIPTYYGGEICYVNGMQYAWNVVKAVLVARLQSLNLMYRRQYDVRPDAMENAYYTPKLAFESTHSVALKLVEPGQRVVDIGCGQGHLARALKAKGCFVIGLDRFRPGPAAPFDEFIEHDLDAGWLPRTLDDVDAVLLLDVIEHLKAPELFVGALHAAATRSRRKGRFSIIVSTGNIGFIVPRVMLMLGQFNYGKRGILDLTHTRLFTFSTLRSLFEAGGFRVISTIGLPAPVPLVVPNARIAGALLELNRLLIRASRSLFAYQICIVVEPLPTVQVLLGHSLSYTQERANGVGSRTPVEATDSMRQV